MNRDELRARLLAIFFGELDEHARSIEAGALALERGPADPRELVTTLFRAAHSLKGAARSAGVPLIEAVCHRLEELIARARDGRAPLEGELVQVLLATADALADASKRLRAGQQLADGPLSALLRRLEAGGPSVAAPAPRPAPPSQPPAPPPAAPAAAPVTRLADRQEDVARVPAAKLDQLLARSGELLLARRRAARRQADVAALKETMGRCVSEWRRVEKPLRAMARGADAGPRGAAPEKHGPWSHRAAAAMSRTSDQLKRLERELDRLASGLASDHHQLAQAATPLEEQVRRVSMMPFGEACEGLDRAVRELARAENKDIDLVIEGGQVELDRAILAGMKDPLLHLVRNAVVHGIEPAAERARSGKVPRGTITVSAALKGAGVELGVADDGRGLDLAAIRARAVELGLPAPDDESELARLVFQAGFSTARRVTELSGRGMGLDVVHHRVGALHGSVDVSFQPGRGARFAAALPLTLTMLPALLVAAGGQTFAFPTSAVRRLVRAGAAQLGSVEGRDVLVGDAHPVPLASLAQTLGVPAGAGADSRRKLPLVVVGHGARELAFAVDAFVAEQEVVVKNLGRRLRRVRHFEGATVLPTGQVALILSVGELIETASARAPGRPLVPRLEPAKQAQRRVLVVDDSVTTRSLEKSILEGAGYEVLTAADGAEAWQLLQERAVELVVSDVEMPRLDGFGLTQAIRASKRLRELPVVLVTALESDADRARGLEAGADAYLPKGAFDHRQLLDVIARLL